jgi:hypothetical protein
LALQHQEEYKMILPKGKAVYENLNTSFANLGEMLLDLNANGFTGYVRVAFWEYDGLLFLDRGKVINAVQESQGKRRTGPEAIAGITNRAKEKDGVISAYRFSPDIVTMLASMVKSQEVYKDLSTDFTSLDKLIHKLQGEEHTGSIEIVLMNDKGSGIVFLQAGKPLECILSADGEELAGTSSLPRIIQAAASLGAVFNVYKVAVESAFADSTEVMTVFELPRLLETWGAIIGAVEKASDDLFDDGTFLKTFKEVEIEKADTYPFLDPFAAELAYADGRVTFRGESVKNLSLGLGDCLRATIMRLASEPKGVNLPAKIKEAMEPVKAEQAEPIAKFALEHALPDYLTN